MLVFLFSCLGRKQNIDMNGHLITRMRSPVDSGDTATKVYVDRMQYKTAPGIIGFNPNTFFICPTENSSRVGK